FPARAAPDADEEIYRHQRDLPEDIKEEEVQRGKDPQHPGLQQQKEEQIFLQPQLDPPGVGDRQQAQQGREHDQGQAQSIHAEMVVNAEAGDQLPSSRNWNPPPILNKAVMNSERTNDASEAPRAIPFSNVSLVLDVNRMMIPPTRGRKMIRLSIASLQCQSAC